MLACVKLLNQAGAVPVMLVGSLTSTHILWLCCTQPTFLGNRLEANLPAKHWDKAVMEYALLRCLHHMHMSLLANAPVSDRPTPLAENQ